MSYVIKETVVEGACLKTVVEYVFKDGTKREVEVSHFMPANKNSVILGLENREASEQAAMDAAENNKIIKADIDKDIAAPIEPIK
jgi:hypothetical protein